MDRQRIDWDVGWTLLCLGLTLTTVDYVLATQQVAIRDTSPSTLNRHAFQLAYDNFTPTAGRKTKHKCKPGCFRQDKQCVCPEKATEVQGAPSEKLVCDEGCHLKRDMCVCVTPGTPGVKCGKGCKKTKHGKCRCRTQPRPEQGGIKYKCKQGCTLQDTVCICPEDATKVPGTPSVTLVCEQGCHLEDDMCVCVTPGVPRPGPKYKCQQGCFLQDNMCVCPSPGVQVPSVQLVCRDGCDLIGTQCLCIIPATPGGGQGYICPVGCELVDNNKCRCIEDAKMPDKVVELYCDPGWQLVNGLCVRRFPAPQTPSIQPPSPPIYICQPGCISLGNGWCQCRLPATPVPGQPQQYYCQAGCRLDGQWCVCQSGPTTTKCPNGCSFVDGMCLCVFPAQVIQSPQGIDTYVCPVNCELQGQLCLCTLNPKGIGPATSSTYTCPTGCSLVGKECSCVYPATLVSRAGEQPKYACPENCAIQGNQCICVTPALGPNTSVLAPGKHYVCPTDCTLQNGMCTCLYPASKNKVQPGYVVNPVDVCPVGCTLQSQAKECECVTPAAQAGDKSDPSNPQYICPAVTCSLQRGMCSCVYPIAWVTPPRGNGKNPYKTCPPGCAQQGSKCLCAYPAKRLPGTGPAPPKQNVCEQGCTLQPDGMCLCIFPATEIGGPFNPHYACPANCVLQGTECECITEPKHPGVPDIQPWQTHQVCPMGCLLTNGMCTCVYPAIVVEGPGVTQPYVCPNGCTLNGRDCTCLIPPTNVPNGPENPQRYVCPAASCTLANGMCNCLYPAPEVTTPSGAPRYICPTNCLLDVKICVCSSALIPVPSGRDVCVEGCTLEADGLCLCVYPAKQTPGPVGPTYSCQPGCQLQGTDCLCREKQPGGGGGGGGDPSCPTGCTIGNGYCTCIELPSKKGNGMYECSDPSKCTLLYHSCFCTYPHREPTNVCPAPTRNQLLILCQEFMVQRPCLETGKTINQGQRRVDKQSHKGNS